MRVDYVRAAVAAEAGLEALTSELSRRNTSHNPASENDVIVSTAVLVLGVTETLGLDFDGFAAVFAVVRDRRNALRAQ